MFVVYPLPKENMTRAPKTSYGEDQRIEAIALLTKGNTTAEVARRVGCSIRTIQRWWAQLQATNSIKKKKSTGRPPKLTARDVRSLKRHLSSDKNATAKQLGCQLTSPICRQTAMKYLHARGIHSYVPLKKPFISKKNARLRLQWARQHINLADEQLSFWAFSDECTFEVLCSQSRRKKWMKNEDRMLPGNLSLRAQGGHGKTMVWGVISAHGVGPLIFIDGSITGETYRGIVRNTILPYLLGLLSEHGRPFTFVDDNAPAHNSRIVSETFENSGAQRVWWPPQSPDLNPIENVWAWINQQLGHTSQKPHSIIQLKDRIMELWNSIPTSMCQNLLLSLPRRCQEVIHAKGWQNRIY